MKVAVVLMVRDEVEDIVAWLAWQKVIGIDTVIVNDDGSQDGTDRLIEHAAGAADIRLRRLARTNESFVHRQRECYKKELREGASEFDWIGFFDLDEFLALYDHQDVHDFLERPADIAGVAVNWCNYGSGGHVVKPSAPPMLAYERHFAASEPIGRHCKSFVRPSAWTGEWRNVHYFEVVPKRYVMANGRDAEWGADPGVSRHLADWSVAKIMHYQCRSMEHFVERSRRRDDLRLDAGAWAQFDRGPEFDGRPSVYADAVLDWMHRLLCAPDPSLASVLAAHADRNGVSSTPELPKANRSGLLGRWSERLPSKRRRRISDARTPSGEDGVERIKLTRPIPHDQSTIVLGPGGSLEAVRRPAGGRDPVYALRLSKRSDRLFLLALGSKPHPIKLSGDRRVTLCPAFEIVAEDANGQLSLLLPATHRHVCVEPVAVGGRVTADRHFIQAWERLSLEPLSESQRTITSMHPDVRLLQAIAAASHRLDFVARELGGDEAPRALALLPIWIHLLDKAEAALVRVTIGALASYLL